MENTCFCRLLVPSYDAAGVSDTVLAGHRTVVLQVVAKFEELPPFQILLLSSKFYLFYIFNFTPPQWLLHVVVVVQGVFNIQVYRYNNLCF